MLRAARMAALFIVFGAIWLPLAGAPGLAQTDAETRTLALEPVATNLWEPLDLVDPNDGSGRLFVLERRGLVRVIVDGEPLPEPLQTTLDPLRQRIPADPASTSVTLPERFQNVLGILDVINKSNNEITLSYEVRELAGGRPSQVRVLYVGLSQAYYVGSDGEGGIGRPEDDGWRWEPSSAVAGDVLTALEIVQGKHTPAFVPLPVKLQ